MSSPTPEQIEAEARDRFPEFDPKYASLTYPAEAMRSHNRSAFESGARWAALVAAAGVTPQEPTSERCSECGDKLDYVAGLDGQGCYPRCWRCWYKEHPVEIPAQVDEAELADVIWGEQESRVLDGYVIHTRETAATTARTVAEWLRGGGQ